MKPIRNAILLCGGEGTRLRPLTNIYSKSLILINGKAVIDYAIQSLVSLGIENLIITVGSNFSGQIIDYLEDGTNFGIKNVCFIYQKTANGIASAVNLCKRYVSDQDEFLVMLSDNIFNNKIQFKDNNKAQILLHANTMNSDEIKRFGVASIKYNSIHHIVEKPKELDLSYKNYPIVGLYKFDHKFFEYYKNIKPSFRDEYEVVDIIKQYKENDELSYSLYSGIWQDAGTFESINKLNKIL